jgi:hypothetical protein
MRWTTTGMRISPALESRLKTFRENNDKVGHPMEQIYIPSGRSLYSYLPTYSLLSRQIDAQKWPGYVLKSYETLSAAVAYMWDCQEDGRLSALEKDDGFNFLKVRVNSILKGQLRYGKTGVMLDIEKKRLASTTIAAGQMEIWLFWTLLEWDIARRMTTSRQYFFEEPEAQLHPGAQVKVMEMVGYLVSRGTRFVLTTHSPYVLYAINNFMMASKAVVAQRGLIADQADEVAIPPERVAAYRFAPDGNANSIMAGDVGLIDENELDQVADDLGTAFTTMQEQLESAT